MTAADGTFAFPDLRRGLYLWGIAARGYTVHWQEVALTNAGETAMDVRLVPLPASIGGKVTASDSGVPIAGATVSLGTWSAVTEDAGLYRLEGIAPGPYRLREGRLGS
jgi:Carboxypeptidase regulatory-like domain